MEFNLQITGNNQAELIEILKAFASTVTVTTKPEVKAKEEPAPEKKLKAKVAKEEPADEAPQEAAPVEKETAISIEQIRAIQAEKSTSGKREAVKALLAEFNVAKLTDMDAKDYPHYLPKLMAL